LAQLVGGIVARRIRVVISRFPLEPATPIINLPPPFANSKPFALQEIPRYDEARAGLVMEHIECGEHTGTISMPRFTGLPAKIAPTMRRTIFPWIGLSVRRRHRRGGAGKGQSRFPADTRVVEEWEASTAGFPRACVPFRTPRQRKGSQAYSLRRPGPGCICRDSGRAWPPLSTTSRVSRKSGLAFARSATSMTHAGPIKPIHGNIVRRIVGVIFPVTQ